MVHGTEDTDVPYACSSDMARELTNKGVKHELVTVPGGEHGLRGVDAKVVRRRISRPPSSYGSRCHAPVAAGPNLVGRLTPLGSGVVSPPWSQMNFDFRTFV